MAVNKSRRTQKGMALPMALLCAAVLFSLGASAFYVLQNRYRVIHQAASWKEALLTAEGGVEMAMNEIRKQLYSPDTAWAEWTQSQDGSTAFFTSRTLLRKGEGGLRSWAEVTVDAPVFLRDADGEQWYRIRSAGIAEISGGPEVAGERPDIQLRRLDLRFSRRTGKPLVAPQATRIIEAIVKPVGAFRLALFGTGSVDLTSQNILVDSYDSRDPEKSTNGRYDPAKRQSNGDIATNGKLIDAGNAQIYGNALTNGGTVLDSDNVTGAIRNDFYQEVFAVTRPPVTANTVSLGAVYGGRELLAKAGSPAEYQISDLALSGSEVLTVRGAADGSPTYVQIVVTGNVAMTGQAQLRIDPGVYARIFVQGSADFSGKGIVNPNSPLHLQVYGTDRPKNADGTIQYGTMKIAGNAGFSGSIYAPTYNVELKGGGSTDNIFGAFVGNKVTMSGVQSVHFDEAMADGGLISDYKIVSWFEDER